MHDDDVTSQDCDVSINDCQFATHDGGVASQDCDFALNGCQVASHDGADASNDCIVEKLECCQWQLESQ